MRRGCGTNRALQCLRAGVRDVGFLQNFQPLDAGVQTQGIRLRGAGRANFRDDDVIGEPQLDHFYDVSIGEGAYSETVKISNYMTLMDLVSKGIPIPPDVLISESTLPAGAKQKITAALEAAQMAQAKAAMVAGAFASKYFVAVLPPYVIAEPKTVSTPLTVVKTP